jgi:dTMP kinase
VIVFEGIDGSGSSTLATLLYEYLLSQNKKVLLTAEPSAGPIGNMIREIHTKRILVTDDRKTREKLLSYLFAADRCDHLYNDANGIMKAIAAGYYVISTRYFLSSFAYHVFSRDDYDYIAKLNEDFPNADLTFYLDCPVEHSLKRISGARVPDINEEESNLNRAATNYKSAISKYTGAVAILDATREQSAIAGEVVSILKGKGML